MMAMQPLPSIHFLRNSHKNLKIPPSFNKRQIIFKNAAAYKLLTYRDKSTLKNSLFKIIMRSLISPTTLAKISKTQRRI